MKKIVFLPIFAIATFISMTGFKISNLDGANGSKHKALWGTNKYFYAYKYGTGTSLTNGPDGDGYIVLAKDGSDSVLNIGYTIATNGGAALGLDAPDKANGNPELDGCIGFKYKYKGTQIHNFRVAVTGITADKGQEHAKQFAAATEWKTVEIPFDSLKQPNDASPKITFNTNIIEKLAWIVIATGTGSLSIKDFECIESEPESSSSASAEPSSSSEEEPSSSSVEEPLPSSSSEEEPSIPSSSSSLLTNNSSSSVVRSIIDDFADSSALSKLGGYWSIYKNDSSTVDNEEILNKDGSNWYVGITSYTLTKEGENEPFAGIVVENEKNFDLSSCEGGFEYKYRGAAHNFMVELSTVEDYAYHSKTISASNAWKTVSVALADLQQPDWGDAVSFDPSKIKQFAWEAKGGISTTIGRLLIDDFTCLGVFPPPEPPSSSSAEEPLPSSSSPETPSSSSNAEIISSSSGSETPSSSSEASQTYAYCVYPALQICTEGPFASCPEGGLPSNSCPYLTPIAKLPHIVHSNAISPMHNGVNLQVLNRASIQIFDLKGNAIRTLKFEPGNYVVKLTDLPRGLYVAKATSASWKQTVKIYLR